MNTKKLLGIALTASGILLYVYVIIDGAMKGSIGVKGGLELTQKH